MTLVAAVSLLLMAVLLWPAARPGDRVLAGRPPVGAPRVGSGPQLGGTDPLASPAGRLRALLAREVRIGPRRRGWAADFAELAAVGLDAGLPSTEAALLACAVGGSTAPAQVLGLAKRLADVDAAGGRVGDCLAEEARADDDLAFLAAAWQLTDEFGVPAAPAARTAAEVLRERAAADDRRTVLAAGPRASMWLLTLLPVSGPVVAALLGLRVTEVYAGTAAIVSSGAGIVLTAAGWFWARTLLSRSLRAATIP